jgi:hypothetical protein
MIEKRIKLFLLTNIKNPWKWLADIWGVLTIIFFIIDFYNQNNLRIETTGIAIIYTAVLLIYTSNKEYARWKRNNFTSQYHGEIFIALWTLLLFAFAFTAAVKPNEYIIPPIFYTTYITILGLFAVTLNSKKLKTRR